MFKAVPCAKSKGRRGSIAVHWLTQASRIDGNATGGAQGTTGRPYGTGREDDNKRRENTVSKRMNRRAEKEQG